MGTIIMIKNFTISECPILEAAFFINGWGRSLDNAHEGILIFVTHNNSLPFMDIG